jgi:hypothetical protein
MFDISWQLGNLSFNIITSAAFLIGGLLFLWVVWDAAWLLRNESQRKKIRYKKVFRNLTAKFVLCVILVFVGNMFGASAPKVVLDYHVKDAARPEKVGPLEDVGLDGGRGITDAERLKQMRELDKQTDQRTIDSK